MRVEDPEFWRVKTLMSGFYSGNRQEVQEIALWEQHVFVSEPLDLWIQDFQGHTMIQDYIRPDTFKWLEKTYRVNKLFMLIPLTGGTPDFFVHRLMARFQDSQGALLFKLADVGSHLQDRYLKAA